MSRLEENVVTPKHYTDSKIEVIDYIEDKKLNFNLGNVVKYISRAGKKSGNKFRQDLEKALWYLTRELKSTIKDPVELAKVLDSIRNHMCETDKSETVA